MFYGFRQAAKLLAPDFNVARFIKFSKEHTSRLTKSFESLAELSLHQVKYKEKIELNCQPVEVGKLVLGTTIVVLCTFTTHICGPS